MRILVPIIGMACLASLITACTTKPLHIRSNESTSADHGSITAEHTFGVIGQVDPKTGLLKSDSDIPKANILVSKKLLLAPFRGLAVTTADVSRHTKTDVVKQLEVFNFFEHVVNFDDLPQLIIANNLQDKVKNIKTFGDLKVLSQSYHPFLFVRFSCVAHGGVANVTHRITVTNVETLENVFVSEVEVKHSVAFNAALLLSFGAGITKDDLCDGPDQDVRYPLYNSFIEWINENK